MGRRDERQKAVGLCERCRGVYTLWVHPDGEVYPISPHNNCSCDERELRLLDDV